MATASIAKPSKWFSNKTLKLTLPRLRSKSKTPSPPPSLQTPKNSQNADKFQEVFSYFDGDGDGKISGEELRAYFESTGESMSHDEAQRVIGEFDTDGDDLLEFQDFVRLMERDNYEDDDDLRRAFEMFEVDKGSGCITPKGLQQVLNRLGGAKSYEECVAMIRVFDLDGNGVLDFHEFHHMMT
uniref:EF-hand domain-containing protein n=1 Tax=Davidia involucrata TaxID=16924 RepID=A0A5B7B9I9_DAVIN